LPKNRRWHPENITLIECYEMSVLQNVCCWRIVLQKPFWGDERKFLEPLMRFARGDVRDHIVSSKIDQRPS
jgi:hypothetical protein